LLDKWRRVPKIRSKQIGNGFWESTRNVSEPNPTRSSQKCFLFFRFATLMLHSLHRFKWQLKFD
jgi:hypothetical protein